MIVASARASRRSQASSAVAAQRLAARPRARRSSSLVHGVAAAPRVVGREAGPGQKRLDAAAPAAVARRPRPLVVVRPRQRVVSPLAGDRVRAGDDARRRTTMPPPVPVPRITPKTTSRAGRGAVGRLGHGEAVRVVGEPHRPRRAARSRSCSKRPAVQPRRVRVLDEAGRRRDRAGHADADRARRRRPRARPSSTRPRDRVDRRRRSRRAASATRCSQTHAPVVVEHDRRDLGAAEIDAERALFDGRVTSSRTSDVQLAQLRVVDRRRRAGHQIDGLRRLRERDDLANRRLAAQQRDDAIEAERDAAVRRRAVLERVEEEAEARPRVLVGDAEQAEDVPLHVGAMDSDAAAGDLRAVERQVVRARAHAVRAPISSSGTSSGRGDVNGWCIESQRFSSAFHSNSGNSVTQRSGSRRRAAGSARFATCRRSCPSTSRDESPPRRP